MRKKLFSLVMIVIAGAFLCTACGGSGQDSSGGAEANTDAEAVSSQEDEAESQTAAEGQTGETMEDQKEEVHPYAWMGLEDIPGCKYLDILSTNHYIQTYDAFTMSISTEETEARDGINTVKINDNSRVYSIDGHVLSISEIAKTYMETEMGESTIEAAKKSLASAMESGNNISGRAFVEKGKGPVPEYDDHGDEAEYEYYEYNYPASEELGTKMTERYYMKDGDVYAIYQGTKTENSEIAYTKVIKSISADIPEGTFDLPDLEGYEKYESN